MNLADVDLRVLVVAEDHLARSGLVALVAEQPGASVTGQVSGAEFAEVGAEVYGADVAVWDMGWNAEESLGHLAETIDAGPPVVALVTDESVAADAWAVGARGLLLRDIDSTVLVSALDAVSRGLAVIDPLLESRLMVVRGESLPPPLTGLTSRELDVLRFVAEGLPNKAIAASLSISEHTVKFHLNAILSKLGAQSRTEAVTRATRMGLMTL